MPLPNPRGDLAGYWSRRINEAFKNAGVEEELAVALKLFA